ncbi:MAG: SPOR domain-containing protein [Propionivibrio sp.]|jgi:cell division protein FtsN|nr:SPOR domain-containing protein [Propionivibrio sp.]MBP6710674.1 SPOR domain-containing protein [Propionivibrio sp.]MBP7523138.1 SPOR domain-containing protein [Propionivibrio sp.]
MSRDMKPRKSRSSGNRKKSGGGTLIGLFLGLVIGVVAAAGVVWYINKSPTPFADKGQRPPSAVGANGTPTPLALPGKPGDPVPEPTTTDDGKPRFDFYKILPGNAEAIPDPKADEANQTAQKQSDAEKEKEKQAKEGALKDPVYLQTGSFQNAADADNQKAKLALMGAEASVQQVMLQDKVWYRVRLGPFKKQDEVNHMRAELSSQGIEANIVKKD